ncbi:replication factor C large subunit [Candidatus Woesearchaeota archaeon]|nr:replication factor C large subunit [Candidatus Woesearchaeota archaeon]
MTLSWVKKYEPKKIGEIEGQDEAVKELDKFVESFSKQKKRAVLLYGPSGSGKTVSVYAVAKKHNLEMLEVNASDFRNKEQIDSKVGHASRQMSLFTKGKVILVDEIEGLSGQQDRGGLAALAKLIDETAFPIVLTAQNPWDQKFNAIRKKTSLIHFEELGYSNIYNVLKRICKEEKIKFDDIALKGLARRAGGDLRAGINDLQSLVEEKKELTRESLEYLSQRSKIESMPSALIKVLKNSDPKIALGAFENVEEDIDKQFIWLDENLPKEYKDTSDLARAYEFMSRADVFKGRIRRWQHWRFLVYVNALLTAGVAVSKDEKYKDFVSYTPTRRILKIWAANMKYQKRKAIAAKIAEKTHTSSSRVMKDTLPYLQTIFRENKKMGKELADGLDLEPEELDWLSK